MVLARANIDALKSKELRETVNQACRWIFYSALSLALGLVGAAAILVSAADWYVVVGAFSALATVVTGVEHKLSQRKESHELATAGRDAGR